MEIVIETDGGDDAGADYALLIPAGGSVEVESGAGDVEVSGLSGNVTVGAEAGDVTVRDVGGNVRVEAPQGDVTVANINTDTGGAELESAPEMSFSKPDPAPGSRVEWDRHLSGALGRAESESKRRNRPRPAEDTRPDNQTRGGTSCACETERCPTNRTRIVVSAQTDLWHPRRF